MNVVLQNATRIGIWQVGSPSKMHSGVMLKVPWFIIKEKILFNAQRRKSTLETIVVLVIACFAS